MPLLLYCVASETAPDTTVKGVGGAAVCSRIERGLKFFYSEVAANGAATRDVVDAAQAVHRVISDIFKNSSVLPFRYPTLVTDELEITQLAADRGDAFCRFLERVTSKVQMDIRLTLTTEGVSNVENARPASKEPQPATGTTYLQARAHRQATLSAAAETCRLAAGSNDLRVRDLGENSRCQVLIERVEVISFLERMRTLELPDGVSAAVSGPWPPTGFWDDELR